MKSILITFKDLNTITSEALQGLIADISSNEGIEIQGTTLLAYFKAEEFQITEIDEICTLLNINYTQDTIDAQNWNAMWESNFAPIAIDKFCYIKANFHPHPTESYQYLLEITPKMSFGTGHHATTRLVIESMATLEFNGKDIFDFGTGTGILAILAEKMGASKIIASDNDIWSIENAKENIINNNCYNTIITDEDVRSITANHKFDIIIANINRHILLEYMLNLQQSLQNNGQIILSGILKEDIQIITQKLEECNLKIDEIKELNNWICIVASTR